jgi:uncharacterized protein YjbI with pentapeptide repeats
VLVVFLIRKGYDYTWTGFGSRSASLPAEPAKTLWDWLDLLIVPLFLALGAFFLDGSRKRSDQGIEKDRQRQEILDHYFDSITELLIEGKLVGEQAFPHAQSIARSRTLTALRLLDPDRKAQLLQFLIEARLIGKNPIISLNGADFRAANLTEAVLVGAELRGAYFDRASFKNANLKDADLRGSSLQAADFTGATFANTDLRQAKLQKAQLKGIKATDSKWTDAHLDGAKPRKVVQTLNID